MITRRKLAIENKHDSPFLLYEVSTLPEYYHNLMFIHPQSFVSKTLSFQGVDKFLKTVKHMLVTFFFSFTKHSRWISGNPNSYCQSAHESQLLLASPWQWGYFWPKLDQFPQSIFIMEGLQDCWASLKPKSIMWPAQTWGCPRNSPLWVQTELKVKNSYTVVTTILALLLNKRGLEPVGYMCDKNDPI